MTHLIDALAWTAAWLILVAGFYAMHRMVNR